MKRSLRWLAAVAFAASAGIAFGQAKEIRIAHVYDKTGPLEAYAKQSSIGLMMASSTPPAARWRKLGRKLVVIEKDTQVEARRRQGAARRGLRRRRRPRGRPGEPGVALAMLPVAEEYKKVLLVEPAVADAITGDKWNRYIFRTGRSSTQDAVANAVALGKPNTAIATLAQDYAFGRDGVKAFKEALAGTGAEI